MNMVSSPYNFELQVRLWPSSFPDIFGYNVCGDYYGT